MQGGVAEQLGGHSDVGVACGSGRRLEGWGMRGGSTIGVALVPPPSRGSDVIVLGGANGASSVQRRAGRSRDEADERQGETEQRDSWTNVGKIAQALTAKVHPRGNKPSPFNALICIRLGRGRVQVH